MPFHAFYGQLLFLTYDSFQDIAMFACDSFSA